MGVALLLDPPVSDEIEGLRRALGDPSVGRMPPHVTLVPPVNVKEGDLGEVLRILRVAASASKGPMALTLGSVTSFLPDNPVAFLSVGGDLDSLAALREAVFRGPLERALSWPWVPHVTVADGLAEDRVLVAAACLDGYRALVKVDRVVLLEERAGRVWSQVADARLGRQAVVGRGGLALEITAGRLLDPEVLAMIRAEDRAGAVENPAGPVEDPAGAVEDPAGAVDDPAGAWRGGLLGLAPIVHAGRREGIVVGMGAAWLDATGPHVAVLVRSDSRRQGVGAHLLRSVEAAAAREGWGFPELQAEGPEGFYAAQSAWSMVTRTRPRRTGTAS
jgi:2'-5' RNA ligase/GNAT superfamily N-acetyltransferase